MSKISMLLMAVFCCVMLFACTVVTTEPGPCDGVTCDGNGVCLILGESASCECNEGYVQDGPLGCVAEVYSISLEWSFGSDGLTCSEAGVVNVRVQMSEGATSLLDDVVACEDFALIEPVGDGTYNLALTGLSETGEAWYTASETVIVDGNDEDLGVVAMDPLASEILIDWNFGVSEFNCVEAGVSEVKVTLVGIDLGDGLLDCEVGANVTELEMVTYNIILEGICDFDGSVGYSLDADLEVTIPGVNDYGVVTLDNVGGCL